MHSSQLRGDDFDVVLEGRPRPHAEVFADIDVHSRVGVVCAAPLDGLGAAALILAHVTAFYDRYRAGGGEFFAYPDFFTFQLHDEGDSADYAMLDIWPAHKNVPVAAVDLPAAITDRAIDTLLLPSGWRGIGDLQPVARAALQRGLRRAYEYGPDGTVEGADLSIGARAEPLTTWMGQVAATVAHAGPVPGARVEAGRLRQSFRRRPVADALQRL